MLLIDELWCRRKKVNKKKSRQAPGVSSFALQEAHDIFGDVDELLRLRKQGLAKIGRHEESSEWRERRLEDEFEPIILAEKYMTEKDDQIREIDIPERMQVVTQLKDLAHNIGYCFDLYCLTSVDIGGKYWSPLIRWDRSWEFLDI